LFIIRCLSRLAISLFLGTEKLTPSALLIPAFSMSAIIDEQTVILWSTGYEFVEWSHYDVWSGEPDDEPVLGDTQAFIFMDSDRTVTAIYEAHPLMLFVEIDTDPAGVLLADPEAVCLVKGIILLLVGLLLTRSRR
jgi:hypothetical protein